MIAVAKNSNYYIIPISFDEKIKKKTQKLYIHQHGKLFVICFRSQTRPHRHKGYILAWSVK